MYLFTAICFAIFGYGFYKRLPMYRLGKPLNRLDKLPARIYLYLRGVFTQSKVLRIPEPGTYHGLFFWGFLLLFIGTLLIMVQADFSDPLLGLRFLKGIFYKGYSLVLDIAGIVAIIMLAGLAVRRFVNPPEGLETIVDDYLIHVLLFAILVTGFFIEAARMAVTEVQVTPHLARFSPIGLSLTGLFAGQSAATVEQTHRILWWVHFFLAIGFIAAIPFTKLRHIFTTSTNYLLVDMRTKGSIATLDLEDENAEQFGVAKVTDLAWKDVFDADACTTCKRCQDRCPAYATGKPLSPMKVIQQIGHMAQTDPSGSLVQEVTEEVLWDCTTCRACQDICPADIEHVNKILDMRRSLSLMDGAFPGDEVRTAINHIEVNGNPFGSAFATRGDWTAGLDVKIMAEDRDVDVLYFVGCYASFDKRNRNVARNFVSILNAAGIKVGILGKEEKCCGEPPRKLGNEYLYQSTANENLERIRHYGVKRIVTTCPHCYNTLMRDYRDLGLEDEFSVEHHSTLIQELLAQKRIALKPEPFLFTYHDSCYIGRYMDIFDQPRSVLESCGGSIAEMEAARKDSFCCGAGGGRILAEEKIGTRINVTRVKMAQEAGAPLLVSNCPFCLTMFEDGIKTGGMEGEMTSRDLAEIVAERLVS
ncbi:electron transporter [Geomonas silvestris]|uniref:Electron transporter n=2 Tax=Geomonas silvestris TaxID=2740184 RepID=A0A6V8MJ54_9BACT|nr:electron transporter [Geomonas silvestris]